MPLKMMIGLSGPMRIVVECLQPDTGGAAGAHRRRTLDDWLAPLGIANELLLTPSLYASLAAAQQLSSLPDDTRDYLELLHSNNIERNQTLRRQAVEALACLQSAGVRVMILKGALSLFDDYYPDFGARLFRDIDALILPEDLPRATAALESLGYRVGTAYETVRHAYAEYMRPNDPGAIDLHVEVIDASHLLPAAKVWQTATEIATDGIRLFMPCPTDRIIHNVLHAQIHHEDNYYRGNLDIRQVYDLTLLARRYGTAIDWLSIENHFERHRLETALHSYALAATTLFKLPWPFAKAPSLAARVHFRRCLLQLRFPAIMKLALPWGNLRGAFAWHRMNALYRDMTGGTAARRMNHAIGFIKKSGATNILNRLFRPD